MNPAFKIGIIGAGNFGGTLGVHFFKAGHQVTFGSKNPGQLTDPVTEAGKKISVGNTAKTFDFGLVSCHTSNGGQGGRRFCGRSRRKKRA